MREAGACRCGERHAGALAEPSLRVGLHRWPAQQKVGLICSRILRTPGQGAAGCASLQSRQVPDVALVYRFPWTPRAHHVADRTNGNLQEEQSGAC